MEKMFKKEIEHVVANADTIINVNINNSQVKCRVIGYGVVKSPINNRPQLKVLLEKVYNSNGYKFPKYLLQNYVFVSNVENSNPNNFASVPFNCIKNNYKGQMISCY